ncbi:hypothetical protein SCALM49S_06516 [Streptomyces californicus]
MPGPGSDGVLDGRAWGTWRCLGGLLHAVITVTFGVNHIVSGVAINILAVGVTRYLSNFAFDGVQGGSSKQSPRVDPIDKITIPGLSDWLQDLQQQHWFLVSDIAGIVGGLVTGLSLLTVVALLLIPATWWILWRTWFGLRLRSCGESPVAAETLGVNVYKYKYIAVTVSGGLAGLGGAFLAIVATGIYQEGQTGGRGYIGLAAMIFGNWMPGGMALGAGLFGFTDSLKLRGGAENVHAMLLLLAILLVIAVFWQLYRKKYVSAVISAAVSALLFTWYFLTDQVPSQFVDAAPYVARCVVLSLSAQRLRMRRRTACGTGRARASDVAARGRGAGGSRPLRRVRLKVLRQAARTPCPGVAPYWRFPVGVAARVDEGRTVTGCNVENASYGLSLCAECGLVSTLRPPAAAG